MPKPISIVLLIAALVSLSGCGGSGVDSALPLSNALRTIRTGDTWQWNYSLSTSSGSTTGVATQSALNGNIPIQPYLELTTIYTPNTGGASTDISWYTQDSTTNSVYFVGGPDGLVSPAVLRLPGSWQNGISFSNSTVGPDGSVIDRSMTVTGSDTVTVPAGRFDAWRVEIDSSVTGVSSTSGVYWFAPQIDEFVKETYTKTYAAGPDQPLSYTYSSQLTQTNVPH